jgi:N-methylhydantoinase B
MEVFSNRLLSITEDMNNTLVRSSFSTNIKERRDCSVGLFDGSGRLIAQGTQIPLHLGSLNGGVAAALKACPLDRIRDGDVSCATAPIGEWHASAGYQLRHARFYRRQG